MKNYITLKYILLLLMVIPLYVSAQRDLPCRIYSTVDKKEITLERLVAQLADADVVFFGEEHNDSIAHALQFEVFKGLHKLQGAGLTLSMEMFQTDNQLVMDEYLKGLITEKKLGTDARLWNNYKDYRPMVEYAKANGLHVLAANAPSRYTNRVTRLGITSLQDLPQESFKFLAPLPIDTLTGRYYEKFVGLLGGHQGMGAMKIYQSQNVWDATMAWTIAQSKRESTVKQILHLNGRFHSDEKLGTYAHLQQYAPQLQLINISSFSHESFPAPNWSHWERLGDYIIITNPQTARSF